MAKIDKIIELILSEARQEADRIMAEADQTMAVNLAENEAEIQNVQRQAQDRLNDQLAAVASRSQSKLENQTRQLKLEQRQTLISEIIGEALVRLKSLKPEAKLKLYRDMVEKHQVQSGQVRLNEADQAILPDLLKALGPGFEAGRPVDIGAGMVIDQGKVEHNLSLDLVLKDNRSELSALVADILFSTDRTHD